MSSVFQIEIPRRSRNCHSCTKPFSDGDVYMSVLLNDDQVEFARCDYCENCYQQVHAQEKPPIMWKGNAICISSKRKEPPDQKERLINLLRETLANPDEADEAFVIALYLARKRTLIFRHEIQLQDGRVQWVYEASATEEMFSVPKVPLEKLQDLEKLQGQQQFSRFLAILGEA